MTLGSLFDGSGGFPLGAILCGITPVWAAEVEPYPIKVTKTRLPFMKHLGNVTEIDGAKIEPVDIITFWSPCQDLSTAGKRAGLHGNRSGLFHEAMRIVKEMRIATNGEKPRYIVWENVTGAFSSNKGEDFRVVLETIMQAKDETFAVPRPEKWNGAGCIVADSLSLAWRTFDAQYWGVPQRRKRIYLVADFDGERAGKILFEQEGLRGNSSKSVQKWKDLTESSRRSTDLSSEYRMTLFENHAMSARYNELKNACSTLTAGLGIGGNNQPLVVTYDVRFTYEGTKNARANVYETDVSRTLSTGGTSPEANQGGVAIVSNFAQDAYDTKCKPKYTVRKLTPIECARLQGFPDWWCNDIENTNPSEEDMKFWRRVFKTYYTINGKKTVKTDKQIVKWLSSDNGDSARYKMWGNGVALPNVIFVLSGIAEGSDNMCLKYTNQLTDEQLKEIYQLFLCEDEKIVSLDISRYDDGICLNGKIEIPEFEDEYLKVNPHATIVTDNDYFLSDYNVKIYHHSGSLDEIYRKYMFETFGTSYALDYLFNYYG